jgi:hypothetical protein
MKKIRIIFSVLALVLAIGGVFATQYSNANATVVYEPVADPLPRCREITETCFTSGTIPCTHPSASSQLRERDDIENGCGALMWKQ